MAKKPKAEALHRNGFKFHLAALICIVVAGVSLLTFASRAASATPGDLVFLVICFVITAPIGATLWGRARDERPELVVGAEGIADALYGDYAWDQIAGFRLRRSWINAGFGYDLKPGVPVARNGWRFRMGRASNRLAGLPARSFKKQMMREPPEHFHEVFRKFRPDLDMTG